MRGGIRLGKQLLGFAVAGALLALVARSVPWQDRLTLRASPEVDAGAEAEVYRGELLSDWRGERVRFRFAPGQETPEDSPLRGSALESAPAEGAQVWATPGGLEAAAGGTGSLELAAEWRPGMPRAFRELDLSGVLPAFGFVLLCTLFVAARWWLLLAMAGCTVPWGRALRLTYVGLFFNIVLPGQTGGDLARAYVVVRDHPDRRADALMSVMMDRVLGLVAMGLLATLAIYANDARFGELRPWVAAAFLVMAGGLAALVTPGLRRLVRFDALIARLPQARRIAKLDRALVAYAARPGQVALAIALSCGNHLAATAAVYGLGHAFGDGLSFLDYLCIVTVANTLSAVPISPGGLGVGEVLYGTLFRVAGGLYMLGVASSFTYRLLLMAVGLLGGIALVAPGGPTRRELAEVREAVREGERAARDD